MQSGARLAENLFERASDFDRELDTGALRDGILWLAYGLNDFDLGLLCSSDFCLEMF